jgi:hypothetical protein
MPIGPKGEKRPADAIGSTVLSETVLAWTGIVEAAGWTLRPRNAALTSDRPANFKLGHPKFSVVAQFEI